LLIGTTDLFCYRRIIQNRNMVAFILLLKFPAPWPSESTTTQNSMALHKRLYERKTVPITIVQNVFVTVNGYGSVVVRFFGSNSNFETTGGVVLFYCNNKKGRIGC
jgi:hypothetical protein